MVYLVASAPDGKPKVMPNGKLSADPTCCNKKWFLVIYNSNSAHDDNFRIAVNGTLLSNDPTIDNSTDSCTGRFFSDSTQITAATLKSVVSCAPNFQPTEFVGTADFIAQGIIAIGPASNNILRIQSIFNNFNGNFGSIRMGFAVPDGFNWQVCYFIPVFDKPVGDPTRVQVFNYNFISLTPTPPFILNHQDFYFSFPEFP